MKHVDYLRQRLDRLESEREHLVQFRDIVAEIVADAEEYGHGNPALIERARAAVVAAGACRFCGGKGYTPGDPEGDPIEECSNCAGSGAAQPLASE